MRLSEKKLSSYVIQRKEAVTLPHKNLFRNMKEVPRAVRHIKGSKTLFINIPDAF